MSQLYVTSQGLGITWALNCMAFTAPLAATVVSVQTQTLAQHFPIKVNQPEAEFDIVFASERDFQAFQQFVRACQVLAQTTAALTGPGVMLHWPQRDIMNWTGVIKSFVAGGKRANPTPHAKLQVSLLTSLVATTTNIASIAANWMTIFGLGMADGILTTPGNQALTQNLLGALGTNAMTLNPASSSLSSIMGGGLGIPGLSIGGL